MNILLTELINLPGVIVEDWQQTKTELILCVEIDADKDFLGKLCRRLSDGSLK